MLSIRFMAALLLSACGLAANAGETADGAVIKRILDDGVVTERGPADEEEVDILSIAISWRIPAEMPVQPCGRDNSICLLVQIDMDNHPISGMNGDSCSRNGNNRSLASPQSRNAPMF